MADSQGVWGIEIGQAGLKAIRLRYAEAANQALAVAFDYIPHPKILSQPDAIPEELIPQALEKFLKRNKVAGDKVAISVPGQSSLLKFIKLPPVESSKVAEIVKYEARQQIPFALEDVIWDFQPLGGGADEDTGFVLDAEVGLFAMKRDQVLGHLKPFTDEKLEIELIQSAPLAVFNMVAYDQLGLRVDDEGGGPGDEYAIIVDIGADNTTMLISNGGKIWIRNIPVGGNHFTRALSKEMKLTFAKAEHLKCNATKSPDPRAVFQALRPVFNDFVAEIQRSIGYFSSVNRDAKITKVIGVGNGFKMAGLQKFLEQNLQYEVTRLDRFKGVVGDSVLSDPLFEENVLTFAVPYGLALQALGLSKVHTSLLPPEIATARLIRRKKPWAMAAAATLLFAFAASAAGYANVARSYSEERFGEQEAAAANVDQQKKGFQSNYDREVSDLQATRNQEDQLVEPLKTREYWIELYRAVNACLPRPTGDAKDADNIEHQQRIKMLSLTAERFADLSTWSSKLKDKEKIHMSEADKETPPEGEGYVFTLVGTHFYNDADFDATQGGNKGTGIDFVVNTLLKNLQSWKVTLPELGEVVPVGQIGISHPTILQNIPSKKLYDPEGYQQRMALENATKSQRGRQSAGRPGAFGAEIGATATDYGTAPTAPMGPGAFSQPGAFGPRVPGALGPGGVPATEGVSVNQLDFTIQFVWKPTPVADRVEQAPGEGEGDQAAPQ